MCSLRLGGAAASGRDGGIAIHNFRRLGVNLDRSCGYIERGYHKSTQDTDGRNEDDDARDQPSVFEEEPDIVANGHRKVVAALVPRRLMVGITILSLERHGLR